MSIYDLQILHNPKPLQIAFESLYTVALGDHLHVVGLDETQHTRHLAVDGRDKTVSAAAELPLVEVTGLATCDDALIVTGVTSSDHPMVLGVDHQGQVLWHAKVPADVCFQHWPRPVCAEGKIWLFSITSGACPEMWLIQVNSGRLGAPLALPLADDTDTIDVLGDAAGVLIARVHGDGERLELMRVVGGRVAARSDVEATRPAAPSLAHVDDKIALAWVTQPSEPRLQWFDSQLRRLAASEVLLTPPSGLAANVRLMAAPDGALAIVFWSQDVIDDGETVRHPDGTVARREPHRALPLRVAAYDVEAHRLGPWHLVDGDAKLYAGDWLSGSLALVHRRDDTWLTIFERKARSTT